MLISTRLTRLFGAAALALGVIAGTAPASATTRSILAGSVTLTPGLPLSGCVPQRLTFDGTITITGTTTRVEPVRFESTNDGCGDLTGTAAAYVRNGNVITAYGAEELLATLKDLLGDAYPACVFIPTSVYPELVYMMVCVLSGEDAR